MNWLDKKPYDERGVAAVVVTGRLAKQLKALADEKRLQIIKLLGRRSICVCELESLVELTQPAVSHHLKILREAELVTDTRHGKWIFYSLNESIYTEIINTLTALPLSVVEKEGTDGEINFCLACEQKKQN
jgi:DNA-binding transcriptional ArsR family regulator